MTNEATALTGERPAPDYETELATAIADAAWDRKALGLKVLDMRGLVSYTDYLVLCSGSSDRHVLAIADSIESTLRPTKIRPLGVEGREDGKWVLMDYGDVVVHIFHDPERDVYGLDSLWNDAPKLGLKAPPGLERPAYS
jgi:ribosome-associated protein